MFNKFAFTSVATRPKTQRVLAGFLSLTAVAARPIFNKFTLKTNVNPLA